MAAMAAFASRDDAVALSLASPECHHAGESWTDAVNFTCASPAVPGNNSVDICLEQLQSDNPQTVSIIGGDTFPVRELTQNQQLNVRFGAGSPGTATITSRQTNTNPPYDQPVTLGLINVCFGVQI
jgi:hypothetical protein